MKEIRFHGRGGQGAVLAARMLAIALVAEGKNVASFPMYGFERRGAPVVAFTRFDDKPIMEKTQIYNPDCLVVIDPGLLKLPTLFTGLNPGGMLILNSPKVFDKQPNENLKIAGVVNATTGRLVRHEPVSRQSSCVSASDHAVSYLELNFFIAILPPLPHCTLFPCSAGFSLKLHR